MLRFEQNQYSEHRVKTFENRYFKKAKGQNVKEVFLTDKQLDDVYKNSILTTAMKEFCLRDSSRLRQHPQAPDCPAGLQYLVEVEAARWERLEEVLQQGYEFGGEVDKANAAELVDSMDKNPVAANLPICAAAPPANRITTRSPQPTA